MKTISQIFFLSIILILGMAPAALAENVDYHFHWSPCPVIDDNEGALSVAVYYEIWVKKGNQPEERVATQRSDTTYVLSAEPSVVQRIRVNGVDASGRKSEVSEWSEPIYFEASRSSSSPPPVAEMKSNYPNPFNPETRIVYGVPSDLQAGDPVRLDIYNVAGLRVRTLEVDPTPGWHEATWDGKNDRGETQATGMYVSQFTAGSVSATQKMLMVK
ncbi:MAG: hypothetical protein GY780_12625 [bacterium]|nr:hypothetical protein [bacterium]